MTKRVTQVSVTTHEIADWLKRGLGLKDIGWAIISKAMNDDSVECSERRAFGAWENGADWALGFKAHALARRAVERKRHQRATFSF